MKPYYSDDLVQLYAGDALAILRELPTGSVDAVVTDPPYSSGGMVRGDRAQEATHRKYVGDVTDSGLLPTFTGDSRDQRSYAYWSALWMSEALRATRPGGLMLSFTDWRQLPATTDAVQSGGWIWRGLVTWRKPNTRPQSGRFTPECEFVVWGSAGAMPGTRPGVPVFPGHYDIAPPRNTREHVTQKPVELMQRLAQIVPEGGTVLDPFMGSGTTGVAAILEGRKFIGCEMVPHYAEVAERRIREAQGQAVARGDQPGLDFGESA